MADPRLSRNRGANSQEPEEVETAGESPHSAQQKENPFLGSELFKSRWRMGKENQRSLITEAVFQGESKMTSSPTTVHSLGSYCFIIFVHLTANRKHRLHLGALGCCCPAGVVCPSTTCPTSPGPPGSSVGLGDQESGFSGCLTWADSSACFRFVCSLRWLLAHRHGPGARAPPPSLSSPAPSCYQTNWLSPPSRRQPQQPVCRQGHPSEKVQWVCIC